MRRRLQWLFGSGTGGDSSGAAVGDNRGAGYVAPRVAVLWLDKPPEGGRAECSALDVTRNLMWRILSDAANGKDRKKIRKVVLCGNDLEARGEVARRVGMPFVVNGDAEGRRQDDQLCALSAANGSKGVVLKRGGAVSKDDHGVEDVCKHLSGVAPSRPFMFNMIVLENRKLILCVPPKNACSTIKHWVRDVLKLPKLAAPHLVHHRSDAGIRYLSDYPNELANAMLHDPTFFKVAVVREPMARTLSGFLNKIVLTNLVDPRQWIDQMAKIVAPLGTDREVNAVRERLTSPSPKLADWVYLLERAMAENRFAVNEHFAPQADICLLSQLHYNHIINFNNLTAELNVINHAFQLDTPLPYVARHATNATNIIDQYADAALIRRVLALYSMDAEPFHDCCSDDPEHLRHHIGVRQ